MSRHRSSIKSALFMVDPVSPKNAKDEKVAKDVHDAKVIHYKGGNTKKKSGAPSYRYEGGEDEIYIVNKGGNEFQLHRVALRETLVELKDYDAHSVHALSPEHTESFRNVVEALRLLYGTDALYELVLEDIRAVFTTDDINAVRPGTVGAFFVGCFNNDNFPGGQSCNPKCTSSIPAFAEQKDCEDLVLLYNEDMFTSLNNVQSAHAYIYIEGNNFDGFTTDNIQQLLEAGLVNVSLIFGNPDGSYREFTTALDVNDLPIATNAATTATTPETTNAAAGIVLLLLIIVILIFLIWLYRKYRM